MAAALWLLSLITLYAAGPAQAPRSEQDTSRPDKQEIVQQMQKLSTLPAGQRDSTLDAILNRASDSTTPRSDFLFCLGSAYLGNGKAQGCVGRAFESGRGIVTDLSDAYVWYSLALENHVREIGGKSIEADRERVKENLQHNYPAPSDEDLELLVKTEKTHMAQSQAELGKPAAKRAK